MSKDPSIIGEISAGEIALFVAGVAFTLLLLGTFVFVMVRAARDER